MKMMKIKIVTIFGKLLLLVKGDDEYDFGGTIYRFVDESLILTLWLAI